jgi:hypothetical protein
MEREQKVSVLQDSLCIPVIEALKYERPNDKCQLPAAIFLSVLVYDQKQYSVCRSMRRVQQ